MPPLVVRLHLVVSLTALHTTLYTDNEILCQHFQFSIIIHVSANKFASQFVKGKPVCGRQEFVSHKKQQTLVHFFYCGLHNYSSGIHIIFRLACPNQFTPWKLRTYSLDKFNTKSRFVHQP